MADVLGKSGLEREELDELRTNVPHRWQVHGVKLSWLRFRDMGRWVKHLNLKNIERTTSARYIMEKVLDCIYGETDIRYDEHEVWAWIRKERIRREITYFLLKVLHGRTECG
jgi:hypothetical protein